MPQPEKMLCCFTLSDSQYLSELLLDAENTSLVIHSRHQIPYAPEPHSLFGESLDHKKISLFECVGDPPYPEGTYPNFSFKRSSFPHYAIIGRRHVTEEERVFGSVSFCTDDLGLLFSASGTFGAARPDPQELQALLEKSFPSRVTVGDKPTIFYFSDIQESVDTDISIGLFSVALEFSANISDHLGIDCPATTIATLRFKEGKTLNDLLDDVVAVLQFLTIIAGRYQGIERINVGVSNSGLDAEQADNEIMSLHWSYAPQPSKHAASNILNIPITPAVDRDEFYKIFYNWMRRHNSWLPARLRIINWQKNGRQYDENRLVAAANAFDILPDSTYPETGELSAATLEARKQCKAIIRALEPGPEKEQASNTLSFWGGKSLKLKVLSRSRIIHNAFGDDFAELDSVLITAVLARNYFVHGTNKFGYEHYDGLISFLTDALEFVFIASDLIECGWDAKRWAARRPGFSHPLAAFYRSYRSQILDFLSAKEKAEQ
ncbi:HEPN domain-containing protein [Azotobacter chroococcum]|uniref:ApeA N-terminal domain-containing protein n=1 Tax=Azotobacter chroococcum TaxID=353 RepID=A0AAP9YEL0_9GAMM|nr:HEPN domain-containing protein [Azotobacter chroococcum]QQE89288.1 hypothetical protein GKQ51_02670 [Azotobacter chroococcum]